MAQAPFHTTLYGKATYQYCIEVQLTPIDDILHDAHGNSSLPTIGVRIYPLLSLSHQCHTGNVDKEASHWLQHILLQWRNTHEDCVEVDMRLFAWPVPI